MTEKLFGTDGIRGIPGQGPLALDNVSKISRIAARVLIAKKVRPSNGSVPPVLIGRDTRASGPPLARAIARGLAAQGIRAVDLGVLPTPGISYLAARENVLGGVVVSASHNPARFNGIKFFDASGRKLDEAGEAAVEKEFSKTAGRAAESGAAHPQKNASSQEVGRLIGHYVDFLRSTFPATRDLSGLRLAIDCANGSASALAPDFFRSLGAEVSAIHCSPNGKNINERCGALYPEAVKREVLARRADCGISFDGDADRAILVDERGAVLDGDAMICAAALNLKKENLLKGNKVVLTVMSNYGLIRFLESRGIAVEAVAVGDRSVSVALERENLSLGGEPSGHLIFRRFAATGDGMLTALQTLAALKESRGRLSSLRKLYAPFPQIIENIPSAEKVPFKKLPQFSALIARYGREFSGQGRIFVRYSGTEPLLRIMVEGPTLARIQQVAKHLCSSYLKESRSRQ